MMEKEILVKGKSFKYNEEALSYSTTTAMSKDEGKQLLYLVKRLFAHQKLSFYLAFGTLLGAIREHDIIDGDEDLDIFVKDEALLVDSLPFFAENGLLLIRAVKGNTYSFRSSENTYIDVYILRDLEWYNLWHFTCKSLCKMYTPKKFFKEYQDIEFLGDSFRCPMHPDKLVEFWYGKNWRTPIRGHKFYYEVKSAYYWHLFKNRVLKKILFYDYFYNFLRCKK